jgi:trehalose 6-phosphate synthase/phosphatase
MQNVTSGRLIVVSNRLPFTAAVQDGRWLLQESVGGLATGIRTYLQSINDSNNSVESIWVGWSGRSEPESLDERLWLSVRGELDMRPLLLDREEVEQFYYGFCNETLWPLFHSFPSYVEYDAKCWSFYERVNRIFCERVLEIILPGDMIWIHDYHLMLLPALLKQRMANVAIGFHLHIPFPCFELFRLLPRAWRTDILDGLLEADLISFHTNDYAAHFAQAVFQTLGYSSTQGLIETENHIAKFVAMPMGIDFQRYWNAMNTTSGQDEKAELLQRLPKGKTILSIDRLDYTKGIIQRLQGYELFLEQYREWHQKVVLLACVAPSRDSIARYQQTKELIEQLVSRINGQFGTIGWTPIIYRYAQSVHGHVESPTDGQLMVPIRGEPADGSPSPAHAKAVPRQGELVLQGAGTGPSAL